MKKFDIKKFAIVTLLVATLVSKFLLRESLEFRELLSRNVYRSTSL